MVYSFHATVAARGYHVYKNTTWDQANVGNKVRVEIETDKKSKQIDPYCCSIKTSVDQQIKTVGHIPREISRHVYFFLKEENGNIDGTVKSFEYRLSPIPAGGLEIPLTLNFKSPRYITHLKMKEFLSTLYSYDYNGNKEDENESSSDEEINLLIHESSEESQSDNEVVKQSGKRKKATLISERSEEGQSDSEVVKQPRKKKKVAVINETPEVDSDSEVVDLKKKKKKKAPLIVESPEVYSDSEVVDLQKKKKKKAPLIVESPEWTAIARLWTLRRRRRRKRL